ncbi:alpha/beta hydrolase family protein [Rhizobium hidalgonense]|uniref:Alpha/beta hydrolase n=1 Tax=Rhizobium hidalgonense TaxID=1538159 RepID=A0ABX4JIZ5_9HYPH|nr:alpha/beta fold hydrolase [Rhizobium hidalgonense]PDT20014.1 alpha/beta hydrolase [Rhizobium hidalgonense]PON05893.1 alpha/beta hydrolase [Rhizobium hidalgonense]
MAEGMDLPLAEERNSRPSEGAPVEIRCTDGVVLGGHIWGSSAAKASASVIINPATGVLARYYHYYARFLAAHGFDVLTYDYRGIGRSRPAQLKGCGYRWREWGEKDFDAALCFMDGRSDQPIYVVGHSIGGFLPGLSKHAGRIDRMLTMGAQYAYWRDYAPEHRMRLLMKWHVVMPVLTALFGYFPGKRLGWLEDLPAGVAHEWSFRRARMEMSHPAAERDEVLARFAAVTAPVLAVAMSDDELGTMPAIRRTLAYYRNAKISQVLLQPADLGFKAIGHFGLFHARHAEGFWRDSIAWLSHGIHPWPAQASI